MTDEEKQETFLTQPEIIVNEYWKLVLAEREMNNPVQTRGCSLYTGKFSEGYPAFRKTIPSSSLERRITFNIYGRKGFRQNISGRIY